MWKKWLNWRVGKGKRKRKNLKTMNTKKANNRVVWAKISLNLLNKDKSYLNPKKIIYPIILIWWRLDLKSLIPKHLQETTKPKYPKAQMLLKLWRKQWMATLNTRFIHSLECSSPRSMGFKMGRKSTKWYSIGYSTWKIKSPN